MHNIWNSKSLVLLYRVGDLFGTNQDRLAQSEAINRILVEVPFTTDPERVKERGKNRLAGFASVLWVEDALEALMQGLPDVFKVAGYTDMSASRSFCHYYSPDEADDTAAQIVVRARAFAGPEDVKEVVGSHMQGTAMIPKHIPGMFKVINGERTRWDIYGGGLLSAWPPLPGDQKAVEACYALEGYSFP